MKRPPTVVSHRVLIISSILVVFKVQYVLMEALALLLWIRSRILFEFIKMYVKDKAFQRHPAAHCAIDYSPHGFQLCDWPGSPGPLRQSWFQAFFSFLVSFLEISLHSRVCGLTRHQLLQVPEGCFLSNCNRFFYKVQFDVRWGHRYHPRITWGLYFTLSHWKGAVALPR